MPCLPSRIVDFQSRAVSSSIPAHVINIEIKDNHEDATLGAFLIYELCQMVWVFVFDTNQK